jgi:hypothetical protein
MPQSIDRIFIERDELVNQDIDKVIEIESLEKDLENFLEDKDVKYLTLLEEAFNDINKLLSSYRFIKLDDGTCFDRKILVSWLNLCNPKFNKDLSKDIEEKEYIARNYSYYSDEVKYIRDFFKNKKVDIPTLDEVKSLVDVKKRSALMAN